LAESNADSGSFIWSRKNANYRASNQWNITDRRHPGGFSVIVLDIEAGKMPMHQKRRAGGHSALSSRRTHGVDTAATIAEPVGIAPYAVGGRMASPLRGWSFGRMD
jgi:hypothetical protein